MVWSPFARRYLGSRFCFLFLRVMRCFSSPGWLGNPRINARLTASLGLSRSSTPYSLLVPRHPPHALNSLATSPQPSTARSPLRTPVLLRHRKRSVLFSGGRGTSSPGRRRYRPSLLFLRLESNTFSRPPPPLADRLSTTDPRKRCSLKMRLHAHTSCKRTAIERRRFRLRLSTPTTWAGPSPLP